MNPALVLFAISIVIAASATTVLLLRRSSSAPAGRWELLAATAVLSFVIAIAVSWLLSWFHRLERTPLVIAAVILGTGGIVVLYRYGAFARFNPHLQVSTWMVVSLAPLLLWITFVLWRGAVVPVLSHDALAYHMPKAVMIARAHRFAFFDAPDPRIGTSPPNYEMLLADVLLLTGTDAVTEWIGTAAYIALLLLAAALAERWWGSGPHIVVTILLTAAVPVILLHAGAHKNDLLSNALYLAALLWGGKWLASQEWGSLVVALVSLAAAGGTKLQAVFPAAGLLLIASWLLARRRIRFHARELLTIAAALLAGLLLLGGWSYVANLAHTGTFGLPASVSSDAGYGDWTNIVEVPLLMLIRPFDSSAADVFVPWRGERWFWPRYEFYFSDFGWLLSFLALAVPFAVRRYARSGPRLTQEERIFTSAAAAIAFILMLAIRIRPFGFFCGFPRYFAFIAVFVIAWSATPFVMELWSRGKALAVTCVTAAVALMLVNTSSTYAVNDTFQPIEYVAFVAQHPGWRSPYFATYRAGTIADQIAGPTDTIAIDAGFDSWIYPLYGAQLQRTVIFIKPGGAIPPAARFVVVDRAWNQIWGDPRFHNMGQYREYLGKGKPTPDDVAILHRLFADRQTYVPLSYNHLRNQAVFVRRDSRPLQPPTAAPAAGSSH